MSCGKIVQVVSSRIAMLVSSCSAGLPVTCRTVEAAGRALLTADHVELVRRGKASEHLVNSGQRADGLGGLAPAGGGQDDTGDRLGGLIREYARVTYVTGLRHRQASGDVQLAVGALCDSELRQSGRRRTDLHRTGTGVEL